MMRFADLFRLALSNLRRNRSRSLLTLIGVAIGVAALLALVSYGAGLQQNARGEFDALELYNTLRVTSRPNPFGSLGDVAFRQKSTEQDTLAEVPLTDSLVAVFDELDGVLAAYPEITFPAQIESGDRVVISTVEAVPMVFGSIPSYQPTEGAFFASTSDSSVLLSPTMARRLGYDDPATIVGDSVTLVTATLDLA
ncbi:MAG: ABC transporter permease, partial [Rhodothermales bacterium]